jgi:hypothetical protein
VERGRSHRSAWGRCRKPTWHRGRALPMAMHASCIRRERRKNTGASDQSLSIWTTKCSTLVVPLLFFIIKKKKDPVEDKWLSPSQRTDLTSAYSLHPGGELPPLASRRPLSCAAASIGLSGSDFWCEIPVGNACNMPFGAFPTREVPAAGFFLIPVAINPTDRIPDLDYYYFPHKFRQPSISQPL